MTKAVQRQRDFAALALFYSDTIDANRLTKNYIPMHTLLLTLMAFAFFALYNTSLKVKYENQSTWTMWIRNHRRSATSIAYILLVISLIFFVFLDGLAIGSFTFFIGLMFIASLIIAMYPLLLLHQKYTCLFVGLCLFFELVIF